MRTMDELVDRSLPPPLMWVCSSIMPLVKYFPRPSMTRAAGSWRFLPIYEIFPSFNNTSVSSKIPMVSLVHTVMFFMSKVCCCGSVSLPNATNGKITGPRASVGGVVNFFFSRFGSKLLVRVAFHWTHLPSDN